MMSKSRTITETTSITFAKGFASQPLTPLDPPMKQKGLPLIEAGLSVYAIESIADRDRRLKRTGSTTE
jgi:hypothetical protein